MGKSWGKGVRDSLLSREEQVMNYPGKWVASLGATVALVAMGALPAAAAVSGEEEEAASASDGGTESVLVDGQLEGTSDLEVNEAELDAVTRTVVSGSSEESERDPVTPEPAPRPAGSYQQEGTWYYADGKGSNLTDKWIKSSGKWYHLGADGAMSKGWVQHGSARYFTNSSGVMQTGWVKTDGLWYFFNSSGALQTGWVKQGSTWYLLGSDGAMRTGWAKQGGNWYYLNSSGAMKTGWLKLGSSWYYLNSSGAMKTGWLKLGSSWYYLKPSGAMVTGQQMIDGRLSKFASNGVWQGYVTAGSGGGSSAAAPVYKNCTDVWNKLGRPIYPSDPGWQQKFDADKDGVGCEVRPR